MLATLSSRYGVQGVSALTGLITQVAKENPKALESMASYIAKRGGFDVSAKRDVFRPERVARGGDFDPKTWGLESLNLSDDQIALVGVILLGIILWRVSSTDVIQQLAAASSSGNNRYESYTIWDGNRNNFGTYTKKFREYRTQPDGDCLYSAILLGKKLAENSENDVFQSGAYWTYRDIKADVGKLRKDVVEYFDVKKRENPEVARGMLDEFFESARGKPTQIIDPYLKSLGKSETHPKGEELREKAWKYWTLHNRGSAYSYGDNITIGACLDNNARPIIMYKFDERNGVYTKTPYGYDARSEQLLQPINLLYYGNHYNLLVEEKLVDGADFVAGGHLLGADLVALIKHRYEANPEKIRRLVCAIDDVFRNEKVADETRRGKSRETRRPRLFRSEIRRQWTLPQTLDFLHMAVAKKIAKPADIRRFLA